MALQDLLRCPVPGLKAGLLERGHDLVGLLSCRKRRNDVAFGAEDTKQNLSGPEHVILELASHYQLLPLLSNETCSSLCALPLHTVRSLACQSSTADLDH